MITAEKLLSIVEEDLPDFEKLIDQEDISQLIDNLNSKDDKLRYRSFLLLQSRSKYKDDVYPFWDIFLEKLQSSNSYQRSIGLMMLADNVRWDNDNKIDRAIDDYLMLLTDEKPITVRQCIQALPKIISHKSHLNNKIAAELMSIDLSGIRETMRKLILIDILTVLITISRINSSSEMESYIANALTGGILDKKSKKQIETML